MVFSFLPAWVVSSVLAAVFWGLSYALSEKILHAGISVTFMFLVNTIVSLPVLGFLLLYLDKNHSSLEVLKTNPSLIWLFVVEITAGFLAAYLVWGAISGKNATVVSLIEISYPLFTCLFAYLLFRDNQINMATIMGAILIFSGVGVIAFKG